MTRLRLNLLGKSQADREQAARLHARLEERGRPQDQEVAESWIAESDSHAQAFEAVQATWENARDSASAPEILSLRQETLARVAVRGHRGRYRLIAAGLAVCLVASVTWLAIRPPAPEPAGAEQAADMYKTAVGERLTIALADGSKVTLNTATKVRVRYTESERTLRLDNGEAYFQVAKNPKLPFRVIASGHSIVAYGTAFDVRIAGEDSLRAGKDQNVDRGIGPGALEAADQRRGQQHVAEPAQRDDQDARVGPEGDHGGSLVARAARLVSRARSTTPPAAPTPNT